MNNTRFSTAVHILTLLADSNGEWLSSDWIAGSININAAMVRKELSVLQEVGLVVGRKGKEGGSSLNKPSNQITLAHIYRAVKNSEILGKKNKNPNPKCPIGKCINERLGELFAETDLLVIDSLADKTLADFVKQFH
ncbi:Rrf2 family transcriptional regulator [Olivibacter sp. SDN3]|uniref:Rrf2 family transcriptional regulator n=1 Tax=Olivibacter sp. SDN3 TaxID=2764720 RepID=UPI00165117E0|nr:Rrf2 family transcriptional regulator [Olivibacter sp. SDN3]QNL51060.1 Rrf2 family transcriptional regulator [Olivibacter sp. SDN3]